MPRGHECRQAAGVGVRVRADATLGPRRQVSSMKTRRSRPRPLGLGRSSATLSPPSCKEDRPGTCDVSHGRGGTRPRTLSLGLDAPSGARLPQTVGCYTTRPVTRPCHSVTRHRVTGHPTRLDTEAALRFPSPPPWGLPSHTSPVGVHGPLSAPCPPALRGLLCEGVGVTTRSVTWMPNRVLAPGQPPTPVHALRS